MSDDAPEDPGVPAWVMTFADLMSLLMCFFVLLLAFSEMDAQKFKQLSGSMKEAFGVQAEVMADYIPKGTSVVTTEFSPGKPVPTSIDSVRQFTVDSTRSTLDHIGRSDDVSDAEKERQEQLRQDLERLRELLREEIEQGLATVEQNDARIIVQIHEHGSFPSGNAELRQSILPTIDKLAIFIEEMQGVVQVTGHTDDVPIKTTRFRSNWDLSAARAVSVAHRLMYNSGVPPGQLVVTGLADTLPLEPNSSAEGRARNRRVQVSIIRTIAIQSDDDPDDAADPDAAPIETDTESPTSPATADATPDPDERNPS